MPEEGKEKISWLTDEKENKQHTTQKPKRNKVQQRGITHSEHGATYCLAHGFGNTDLTQTRRETAVNKQLYKL